MKPQKPITEKFSNDLKQNLEGLVSYLLDKKPDDVVSKKQDFFNDHSIDPSHVTIPRRQKRHRCSSFIHVRTK